MGRPPKVLVHASTNSRLRVRPERQLSTMKRPQNRPSTGSSAVTTQRNRPDSPLATGRKGPKSELERRFLFSAAGWPMSKATGISQAPPETSINGDSIGDAKQPNMTATGDTTADPFPELVQQVMWSETDA